jgi:hypothetical protein
MMRTGKAYRIVQRKTICEAYLFSFQQLQCITTQVEISYAQ